jgi:hypothetical protein
MEISIDNQNSTALFGLIKPYERLPRRNCLASPSSVAATKKRAPRLTNEVRSFSREAVTRRFLAVLLQPAVFLCYLSFGCPKESSLKSPEKEEIEKKGLGIRD